MKPKPLVSLKNLTLPVTVDIDIFLNSSFEIAARRPTWPLISVVRETKNWRDQKQDVLLATAVCVLLMKCFAKSFQRSSLYAIGSELQA
jgi:hypothetical protein